MRCTATSDRESMSQKISLTSASRTLSKDVNIAQKQRNWYVEQNCFSMWQSVLKLKYGLDWKTGERGCHIWSTPPTCQRAWNDGEDFNRHKSNGGTMIALTVNEIRTFKYKRGNSHRARGSWGKVCSKCSTPHPLRECPAFSKKYHKCGHKNHFSTCCRSKQKSQRDCNNKRPPQGRSTERHHRPKGRCSRWRSRSRSNTQSTHSIELNHDQLQQESTVKKCSIPFTDLSPCQASATRQIQMTEQRLSPYWTSNCHTEMW